MKSPFPEADFADYGDPSKLAWHVPVAELAPAEDELVRLRAYMASSEPLWQPPGGQAAGAGRSFDDVVAENLRGLYVSQLKSILRAIDDPRLGRGHLQLLGEIIEHTNTKTGMAYPGPVCLAAAITRYDDDREPQHYREQTISNLIADLKRWGYLVQDKRGVDGRGRAVSHYATTAPLVAELRACIADWCRKIRGDKSDLLPQGEYVRNEGLTYPSGGVSQKADLLSTQRSNGSDLLFDPLNSPRESRKHDSQLEERVTGRERREGATAPSRPPEDIKPDSKLKSATPHANGSGGVHPQPGASSVASSSHPPTPPADGGARAHASNGGAARNGKAGAAAAADAEVDQALAAYNDFARAHCCTVCHAFTEGRRAGLKNRLVDIGGLERFRLALSAIPRDDFLMGRKPMRPGDKQPFKLDLGYLIGTGRNGGGDVLARLIDDALAVRARSSGATKSDPRSWTVKGWEYALDAIKPGDPWPEDHGARPGAPGSLVPAEFLSHPTILRFTTAPGSTH